MEALFAMIFHEDVLTAIVIGYFVGSIARRVAPGGKLPGGKFIEHCLGMLGAYIATVVGQSVGIYKSGEAASWVGAVIGAGAIIFAYRFAWEVYARTAGKTKPD